jgi:uncharacterized protein YecT (DUF1311 family)
MFKTPVTLFLFFLAASTLGQQELKKAPAAGENTASQRSPCGDRETQMEMNQCSAEEYRKADGRLNALYNQLVQTFQKDIAKAAQQNDVSQKGFEQRGLAGLRQAERAWIQYRDAHCAAVRQRYEGGSISPMIFSMCMTETTEHRIQELRHSYDTDGGKAN